MICSRFSIFTHTALLCLLLAAFARRPTRRPRPAQLEPGPAQRPGPERLRR